MAESAAKTRVVRPGTTRLRERREKETYVPRDPGVRIRRAERDEPPGMRSFAQTNADEPKEMKGFAAAPDDSTPPPPLAGWGSRST